MPRIAVCMPRFAVCMPYITTSAPRCHRFGLFVSLLTPLLISLSLSLLLLLLLRLRERGGVPGVDLAGGFLSGCLSDWGWVGGCLSGWVGGWVGGCLSGWMSGSLLAARAGTTYIPLSIAMPAKFCCMNNRTLSFCCINESRFSMSRVTSWFSFSTCLVRAPPNAFRHASSDGRTAT